MQSSSTSNNNISQSNSAISSDQVQKYMQDSSYFGYIFDNISGDLQSKYLTNKKSVLLNYKVAKLNDLINKNLEKTSNQFQTQFKKTHFNQQVYPIVSCLPVFLLLLARGRHSKQNWQKIFKNKSIGIPAAAFAIFSGLGSLYVFNFTLRDSKKLIYRNQKELQKLINSVK